MPTSRAPTASHNEPRQRWRIFDRRTLLGIVGLLELPIIAVLAFLLFGPQLLQAPPTLICDELNREAFTAPRFQTGLSGDLDEDFVFAAGTEYVIQDILVVPHGRRLLIEPGVRLLFEPDAGLDVQGALYGCGSEREPITFTSEEGEPGSWRGILFSNADDDATLSHALIQFAGDRAVNLENSAPSFYDVKIANSKAFPLSSDGYRLPALMVDVALESNPFNGIEIRGGTKADKQDVRWPNHGLVYVVTGPVEIGDNTTLLIDPDTTVKFWQAESAVPGLRVRGLLKAEGVQFTSVYDSRDSVGGATYIEARDPAAGDWSGLAFEESSGKSYLRNALIQYAGREQGAVHLQASSPELSNVTIADSAWYPLSADADSFPSLSDVTLNNNSPGDALEVRGGSAITGREERSWAMLGDEEQIVRVVSGDVVVQAQSTLIIEPGVVVKFEPESKLIVQGTLRAVGDAGEEGQIVFTSLRDDDYGGQTDKNTGPQDDRSWDGLIFDQVDEASILQHAVVRYAPVSIRDGAPQIRDTFIRDSHTAAIWSSPGAGPAVEGVRVQDNATNGLAVWGGTIEHDQVWRAVAMEDGQLVRILTDRVTVAGSAVLEIASGTIIKANSKGLLYVEGGLKVRGDEASPVIFTSLHDDAAGGDTNQELQAASSGDWPGIEATGGATLSFGHTIIRYAQTGLSLRDGTMPQIGGSLRVSDGVAALWCNERAIMPEAFTARDNEDNYAQCPTE